MKKLYFLSVMSAALLFGSCNPDKPVIPPGGEPVDNQITGFYLLNEGAMGSNNARLDFYDYQKAVFSRNIFPAVNPEVTGGLGDVGNDLKIYGSRLYAVINASNLVEVMDAKTAKHIGVISVTNCRSIAFDGGKAYVSSFAGSVYGASQIGYVAEVDTASLQVLRTVNVGHEPEEMEVMNGKLYVVNSGGYNPPAYDNSVSVIDISSFTETGKIDVAVNLLNLRKDAHNNLFALGRGDYSAVQPDIYKINTQTNAVEKINVPYASNFCVSGDSLFILSNNTDYSSGTAVTVAKFVIYNTQSKQVMTENFITDTSDAQISLSYGIAVNSITKEIFITDVKDYVSPGTLFCFSLEGSKKWSVMTDVIPSKIAFLWK
ncbi:MAG: YncE family protein [Prevotellaceae bacterium]|jgi:hypothetical protein|nr:YncE family protein [Prevotellaceae bacterium]